MASEVKWIKIVTDIFDDEKVLLIESMPEADSVIVIWFKLLCFAGKQNNGGVFMLNDKIAYTEEMLATIFRRPLNTIRLAIKTFEGFGMVEVCDKVLTISNWDKHQSLDAYEKKQAYDRKYREEQRKLLANSNSRTTIVNKSCKVVNASYDSRALEVEREEERDREEDKNIEREENMRADKPRTPSKKFTKPSLDILAQYIADNRLNVDPHVFFDHYEGNGWCIGKSPMKDWQATVRNWARRDMAKSPEKITRASMNKVVINYDDYDSEGNPICKN